MLNDTRPWLRGPFIAESGIKQKINIYDDFGKKDKQQKQKSYISEVKVKTRDYCAKLYPIYL